MEPLSLSVFTGFKKRMALSRDRKHRGARRNLLLLQFILALAWVCPASSQAVRSFTLSVDNDGLVFWNPPDHRTDWYYTHGMKAEAILGGVLPGTGLLKPESLTVCPPAPVSLPCVLSRVTFGQSIFTPASLFFPPAPGTDRPYAGWLYAEASALSFSPDQARSLGLQVGVTGSPSMAGPLHRWFHRYLGKAEPVGWEDQVPFELAFAVQYEAIWWVPLVKEPGAFSVALEPGWSLSLGTLRTGATGGFSLRTGWNAPRFLDWAGSRPGSSYIQLSLGVQGEFVVRDLFLDGSTWGQSAHVEKVPVVGHLLGGIQMGVGGFALEVSAAKSSSQFTGQDGTHTVGSVRLIIRP